MAGQVIDITPQANSRQFPLDPARDTISKTVTIPVTSQDLAALLGEALPTGAAQAWVDFAATASGMIFYNPNGAATASVNGAFFSPSFITGPEILASCQLVASQELTATVIVQKMLWSA